MSLLADLLVALPWITGGLLFVVLFARKKSNHLSHALPEQLPTLFAFGFGGLAGYLGLAYTLWLLEKAGIAAFNFSTVFTLAGLSLFAIFRIRQSNGIKKLDATSKMSMILSAWLALFFAVYFFQSHLTPLFAWDALDHWAQNANQFIFQNTTGTPGSFNSQFQKHPPTVVMISAWAGWANHALNGSSWGIPWLLCLISAAMMAIGFVKLETQSTPLAILCAIVLISTPLVETHTLIAGYAELWLATTMMAATLFIAMGHRLDSTALIASGLGVAMLLVTIKNTGAGYTLAVFAASLGVVATYRLRFFAPIVGGFFILLAWIFIGGVSIDIAGLKVIWQPDDARFFFGGRDMTVVLNDPWQIARNEWHSLVANQSYGLVAPLLILICVAVVNDIIAKPPTHESARQRSAMRMLCFTSLALLTMLVASQLFLPEGFAHALPHADTGNSRFSLPIAFTVIVGAFSIFGGRTSAPESGQNT